MLHVQLRLVGPITAYGGQTYVTSQTGTGSTFAMQASPALTTPTLTAALLANPAASGFLLSGAGSVGVRVTSTNDAQAWFASNGWGYNQSAWTRTASSAAVMWGTGNAAGVFEVWTTATGDAQSTAPADANSRIKISSSGITTSVGIAVTGAVSATTTVTGAGLVVTNPVSGPLMSGVGIRLTSTADAQAWFASNGWHFNQSAWTRTASSQAVMWGTGNNAGVFEVWTTAGGDAQSTAPIDGNSRIKVSATGVTMPGTLDVTGAITGSSTVAGTALSDSKGDVRTIPQNSKSAAYTTVLADAGKHLLHPSADTTARTFTIDSNANVAYPIGTAITFVNQNAGGVVTISITTDTMRLAGAGTTGSRTLAANGIATALKITSTEWIISGTNLS